MEEKVVVLVTCAGEEEAQAIAIALVKERLAACASVAGGVQSVYHWKGAVEEAAERLLIAKTTRRMFERLCRRVKQMHSYEVPEIIALPIVDGLPEYLQWIEDETGEGPRAAR